MTLFKSKREKRLWIWALVVVIAIYLSLFVSQAIIDIWSNQNLQAVIFVLGMILTATAILIISLRLKPNRTEIALWIGLLAVFLMLFLRLGLTERSHLFEYAVLAILIHSALIERFNLGNQAIRPALLAFVLTLSIGTLDECLQFLVPNRHFDPVDIFFNGFAAFMAISTRLLLQWVRKKLGRKA